MDVKRKIVPIGFSNYEVLNDTVSRVKVYIQYAGKNRNYSYFTKEAIENALPTIYGVPVVGEYKEGIDNFGGHGGELVINDEGISYNETTKPYGFVPMDKELADVRWEKVEDEFGNSKEYLVANAFLWRRRYPELDIVFEKDSNQSMEILIEDGEFMDDGYFDIQEFVYDALCILGRDEENLENNTEPCFEDAKVVSYSLEKEEFKSEFSKMYDEIKCSLATSKNQEVAINYKGKEFGMDNLEKDNVVEQETVEQEFNSENVEVELEVESTEAVKEEVNAESFEESEENVTEEVFEEEVAVEESDSETVEAVDYESLYDELKVKHDEVLKDFELLKQEHGKIETELNSYKAKERQEAENEIFAKYEETLAGNAEYDSLKEKSSEFSLEELKKELALIYVESTVTFSKKETKKDDLVVEKFNKREKETSKYGDLFERYGNGKEE